MARRSDRVLKALSECSGLFLGKQWSEPLRGWELGGGAEDWRDCDRGSLGPSEAVDGSLPIHPALPGVLVLGGDPAPVRSQL